MNNNSLVISINNSMTVSSLAITAIAADISCYQY